MGYVAIPHMGTQLLLSVVSEYTESTAELPRLVVEKLMSQKSVPCANRVLTHFAREELLQGMHTDEMFRKAWNGGVFLFTKYARICRGYVLATLRAGRAVP